VHDSPPGHFLSDIFSRIIPLAHHVPPHVELPWLLKRIFENWNCSILLTPIDSRGGDFFLKTGTNRPILLTLTDLPVSVVLYYTLRLCVFGPKGAIQIRYYYYYYTSADGGGGDGRGKCPTLCIRGELSGRGKCPGRSVQGNVRPTGVTYRYWSSLIFSSRQSVSFMIF